jgi:two-component sensor histidine kinase
MALIHDLLYRSGDVVHVDFRSYVDGLVRNLLTATGRVARPVRLSLDVEPVPLDLDVAIPCGLVVNELVSNALEHAFPADHAGALTVRFQCAGGRATLEVHDDGVGLPAEEVTGTLGLRLVSALARQLRGEVAVERDHGTRFRFTFPLATDGGAS